MNVEELAKQAGFEEQTHFIDSWECGLKEMERFAELVRQDAYGLPTIEDASQHWAKVDGAVAWHLIERHADNWADVGKMMDEFVAAHVRIEREANVKLLEDFAKTNMVPAKDTWRMGLIAGANAIRSKHD